MTHLVFRMPFSARHAPGKCVKPSVFAILKPQYEAVRGFSTEVLTHFIDETGLGRPQRACASRPGVLDRGFDAYTEGLTHLQRSGTVAGTEEMTHLVAISCCSRPNSKIDTGIPSVNTSRGIHDVNTEGLTHFVVNAHLARITSSIGL
jgi:hypothetical protein